MIPVATEFVGASNPSTGKRARSGADSCSEHDGGLSASKATRTTADGPDQSASSANLKAKAQDNLPTVYADAINAQRALAKLLSSDSPCQEAVYRARNAILETHHPGAIRARMSAAAAGTL